MIEGETKAMHFPSTDTFSEKKFYSSYIFSLFFRHIHSSTANSNNCNHDNANSNKRDSIIINRNSINVPISDNTKFNNFTIYINGIQQSESDYTLINSNNNNKTDGNIIYDCNKTISKIKQNSLDNKIRIEIKYDEHAVSNVMGDVNKINKNVNSIHHKPKFRDNEFGSSYDSLQNSLDDFTSMDGSNYICNEKAVDVPEAFEREAYLVFGINRKRSPFKRRICQPMRNVKSNGNGIVMVKVCICKHMHYSILYVNCEYVLLQQAKFVKVSYF